MKVILLEDIAKIGKRGDVVEVSDGHAINFLIPNNRAEYASDEAATRISHEKTARAQKQSRALKDLEEKVKGLDGKQVLVNHNANEHGQLFASVHESDIKNSIKETYKIELPVETIIITGEVKSVGDYSITVAVGDTKSTMTLSVQAKK